MWGVYDDNDDDTSFSSSFETTLPCYVLYLLTSSHFFYFSYFSLFKICTKTKTHTHTHTDREKHRIEWVLGFEVGGEG